MTETIFIHPSGALKIEPQNDQHPFNSSPQPSTAVEKLISQIKMLLENMQPKIDCNSEPKLSHTETDREIEIKITIPKLNCESLDLVVKSDPAEFESAIVPLQVKVEKINVDGFEFYDMSDKSSHPSNSNVTKFHSNSRNLPQKDCLESEFDARSLTLNQIKFLKKHEKRHCKLSCKICGLYELRTYQSNLGILERDYVCSLCKNDKNPAEPDPKPTKFLTRIRIVNGVKLYECDICGRNDFSHKNDLFSHRRSHSSKLKNQSDFIAESKEPLSSEERYGAKKCVCDLCGRRYVSNFLLKTHHNSFHLQARNYCCEFCGKSYARHESLFVHLKTHAAEKNVICDYCGSRFYTKDKLKCHMLTHFEIYNYTCDICGKRFKRNDKIKTHKLEEHFGGQKTVHGEPLKCLICRKEYKRMQSVKWHMRHFHKINRNYTTAEILNFK